jgi:hypothetical protein
LIAVVPFVAGCDVLFQLRSVDPPPSQPPAVIVTATDSCTDCMSRMIMVTALTGRPSSMLLVSIAVSGGGGAPAIASVTYGDRPLSFILRSSAISSSSQPGLEQWQLLDPPPGAAPLTVTLGGQASSLVVGVAEIEGTRAVEPVRTTTAASSTVLSKDADNTVDSEDLDLVIDAVCSGSSIDSPGPAQTVLYVRNLSAAFTCGNLASSTTDGAAPNVGVHWGVNAGFADHWIDLASSIAPGP